MNKPATISEPAKSNVVRPAAWSGDVVAARKKKADRARKAKQRKHPRHIQAIRLGELCQLLRHRYGRILPSTEAAILGALCHHLALVPGGNPAKRVGGAIEDWAPWMTISQRDELVGRVLSKPKRCKAAKLGQILQLTAEERSWLRITTIRSIDGPNPIRRRRQRNIERKRRIRRAAGSVTRAEYVAGSKSRSKPWERSGVSRATWYRRRETSAATAYPFHRGEPDLSHEPASPGDLSQPLDHSPCLAEEAA
jgi:hypothetical protein